MRFDYRTMDDVEYVRIHEQLANKDTLEVIRWAYGTYEHDVVYACSFGAEGVVLIDLISKVNNKATIIFLDTDFHFEETYLLIKKVRSRYPSLDIRLIKSALSPEQQHQQFGEDLWRRDPDLCCKIRKLHPLEKELDKYKAWISGLRREQSETRRKINFVNKDSRFEKVKICPLIHWTEEEIWMYIKLHQLPYNELHDQSYPSIGCTHCTRPVAEGEDSRSGRWANSLKTECGLHKAND